MNAALHLRKLLLLSLAIVFVIEGAGAQDVPKIGRRVENKLVDRKEIPTGIEIKYEVISDFVVQEVSFFYRGPNEVSFREAKLKRGPDLLYSAMIRYLDPVYFYISLRAENGKNWFVLGSPSKPERLAASDLEQIRDGRMGKKTKKTVQVIMIVLGAVTAITIGVLKVKQEKRNKTPGEPIP